MAPVADRPVPPPVSRSEGATTTVLDEELARMREELDSLRRQLAEVRTAFAADRGAQLREANEQLVLAALRAEAIAGAAEALARGPRAAPVTDAAAIGSDRARALRDANEALLLAALGSQSHEEVAETAHRRQLRYLAVVAHELRSPLSPIRTAAATIGLLGSNDERLLQLQAIISRQVTHMARLVEDLLDAARVDAVDFRVQIEPVDLGSVIEQAVLVCRALIDERRHSLQVELPEAPVIVACDPIRLAQVFNNLLENAAKYTPPGGEIGIRAERRGQMVDVHVVDNGIGIPAGALTRVFDLFSQEAAPGERRGLGIGLAVVRGLVNALGGSIRARSDGPGCGSEFIVTLPLANPAPA
jgi:signal transduction histidine kinase